MFFLHDFLKYYTDYIQNPIIYNVCHRLPRLQSGIACCKGWCRTHDRGSRSATIFTIIFCLLHTGEGAEEQTGKFLPVFVLLKFGDSTESSLTARKVP